jgi:hypothetical protein
MVECILLGPSVWPNVRHVHRLSVVSSEPITECLGVLFAWSQIVSLTTLEVCKATHAFFVGALILQIEKITRDHREISIRCYFEEGSRGNISIDDTNLRSVRIMKHFSCVMPLLCSRYMCRICARSRSWRTVCCQPRARYVVLLGLNQGKCSGITISGMCLAKLKRCPKYAEWAVTTRAGGRYVN